jgi:hypothetical protein
MGLYNDTPSRSCLYSNDCSGHAYLLSSTVLVAAGQVMTRLNLTWEGHEPTAPKCPLTERRRKLSAWRTLLIFVVIQIVLRGLVSPIVLPGIVSPILQQHLFFMSLFPPDLIEGLLWLVGVVLLWKEPSVGKGMAIVFVLVSVLWIFRVCTYDSQFQIDQLFAGWTLDLHIYGFPTMCVMVIRNVRQYVRTKYTIPPIIFETKSANQPSCDDCFFAVCCASCATSQLLRHTADYKEHGTRICSDRGLPLGAPEMAEFEKGSKGS